MLERIWSGAGGAFGQAPDRAGLQASTAGKAIAWAALAAAVAANIAGYALDLYGQFWWFDRILHAFTLFAMTLWLAFLVFAPGFREGYRVRTFFLVLSLGLAIGAVWEIAEWAYDQLAPQNVIKGKFDTVLDLIMDTVGAALAALLCHRFWR
ncbi:MAG TPA: hypothetical protein VGN97_08100 [Mesorhizobium sp.]|jgi:hypothetical protein|nr:hypothetical protein [Mesorhizobium sp.]